jgi:transposase-like protein
LTWTDDYPAPALPEAIEEIWPQATVQLCVVHLVRASLRYAWWPASTWQ